MLLVSLLMERKDSGKFIMEGLNRLMVYKFLAMP